MDNIDGKQARRTGQSSGLGELFEYVLRLCVPYKALELIVIQSRHRLLKLHVGKFVRIGGHGPRILP